METPKIPNGWENVPYGTILKQGDKYLSNDNTEWLLGTRNIGNICYSPSLFIRLRKRDIDAEINNEIYKAIESLGGQSDILGTIGSRYDTMTEIEVLAALKAYNS